MASVCGLLLLASCAGQGPDVSGSQALVGGIRTDEYPAIGKIIALGPNGSVTGANAFLARPNIVVTISSTVNFTSAKFDGPGHTGHIPAFEPYGFPAITRMDFVIENPPCWSPGMGGRFDAEAKKAIYPVIEARTFVDENDILKALDSLLRSNRPEVLERVRGESIAVLRLEEPVGSAVATPLGIQRKFISASPFVDDGERAVSVYSHGYVSSDCNEHEPSTGVDWFKLPKNKLSVPLTWHQVDRGVTDKLSMCPGDASSVAVLDDSHLAVALLDGFLFASDDTYNRVHWVDLINAREKIEAIADGWNPPAK